MRPYHRTGVFLEQIRCVLGVLSVEEVEGVGFQVQYERNENNYREKRLH